MIIQNIGGIIFVDPQYQSPTLFLPMQFLADIFRLISKHQSKTQGSSIELSGKHLPDLGIARAKISFRGFDIGVRNVYLD